MIKRQARILRINAVLQEFLAAESAAELLAEKTTIDPTYGDSRGWGPKGANDFRRNLEATCIIRLYAEFEAGRRDYWLTFQKKETRPKMFQLVNEAIPTQHFPQDAVDKADEVREYRNLLVHDIEDEPAAAVALSVQEVKSRLCACMARLDPDWR